MRSLEPSQATLATELLKLRRPQMHDLRFWDVSLESRTGLAARSPCPVCPASTRRRASGGGTSCKAQTFNEVAVRFVEHPVPDPLARDQIGLRQLFHVRADRRLAELHLFGDESNTNTIFHQIAVLLRREMRPWVQQPHKNAQPRGTGHGGKGPGA